MEAYERARVIFQKLIDENRDVTEFQMLLAMTSSGTGWMLSQSGRPTEAISYFKQEEVVLRKFAEATTATPEQKFALANCLTNLADALRKIGRLDEAQATCEQAIALREPLVKENPHFFWGGVSGPWETYLRIGQVRSDAGDPVTATAAWRKALALYDNRMPPEGDQMFFRACCHAALSGIAARPGSNVTTDEARAESDWAMSWLCRAVSANYTYLDHYRNESALDPLRNRDDFKHLILDLESRIGPK